MKLRKINLRHRYWCFLTLAGVMFLLPGCGGDPETSNETSPATPALETEVSPGSETVIAESDKATDDNDCQSSGDLGYVCGPLNAEDILQLGNSKWLIVSGMNGQFSGTNEAGHIYLVNHQDKSFETFFPGANPVFEQDTEMFAACTGPLNTENFSAHGLALNEQSAGQYRLYMTSHGEREAIEVFDVDARGDKPAITWVGCVMLPEKIWANSVAILSDGGFVTTKFMDPTNPGSFGEILQGKVNGIVYEWHPGGEVSTIAGTELSGPNGIVVSEDDRWMYVAAFGPREIVRFDRTTDPITKESVQVDVTPDNIRWSNAGKLYTVGGNYVSPADCSSPPCNTGWSVIEIDPETLATKRVTGVDQTATMQGASTAVSVGDEIWIGTYSGDRIGYLPKPSFNEDN